MSRAAVVMIPATVAQDQRLTLAALRVLLALAAHADRDGVCWPSRARLAEITGYTPSTISRYTGRLRELGWLRVVEAGGGRRTTRYQLTVPERLRDDADSWLGARGKEQPQKSTAKADDAVELHRELRAIYPARDGRDPADRAITAIRALLADGVRADVLREAVERYRMYAYARGLAGTRWVMQMATFFGPDRRWAEAWEIAPGDMPVGIDGFGDLEAARRYHGVEPVDMSQLPWNQNE